MYVQTIHLFNSTTYYSAWYDDRPILDNPVIRLIGIASSVRRNVYCLLWRRGRDEPTLVVSIRYVMDRVKTG